MPRRDPLPDQSGTTPVSAWARLRLLNEAERTILRELSEAPGSVNDARAMRHLVRLGLVQRFGPGGAWQALTPAGRAALSSMSDPVASDQEKP